MAGFDDGFSPLSAAGDEEEEDGARASHFTELTRDDLYELHHKPHKLTSFEKHFTRQYNRPIAVILTHPISVPPSPHHAPTSMREIPQAPDRRHEDQVFENYVRNAEKLRRGDIDIADLDPGTKERKEAEFDDYVKFKRFEKRKGRADTDYPDEKASSTLLGTITAPLPRRHCTVTASSLPEQMREPSPHAGGGTYDVDAWRYRHCTIPHHHCTITAPPLHHHCFCLKPSLCHHCTITAGTLRSWTPSVMNRCPKSAQPLHLPAPSLHHTSF